MKKVWGNLQAVEWIYTDLLLKQKKKCKDVIISNHRNTYSLLPSASGSHVTSTLRTD